MFPPQVPRVQKIAEREAFLRAYAGIRGVLGRGVGWGTKYPPHWQNFLVIFSSFGTGTTIRYQSQLEPAEPRACYHCSLLGTAHQGVLAGDEKESDADAGDLGPGPAFYAEGQGAGGNAACAGRAAAGTTMRRAITVWVEGIGLVDSHPPHSPTPSTPRARRRAMPEPPQAPCPSTWTRTCQWEAGYPPKLFIL